MCKKCILNRDPAYMHCMHRSAADPETFQTGAGPWVVWGDKQKGVGDCMVGTFWEHFLFIHDIIKTCKSIKIKQIFKSYNCFSNFLSFFLFLPCFLQTPQRALPLPHFLRFFLKAITHSGSAIVLVPVFQTAESSFMSRLHHTHCISNSP